MHVVPRDRAPATEQSRPSRKDAGREQGCCPAGIPVLHHPHLPQAAEAKEELLIKTLSCAGLVSCGQSSLEEQKPNHNKTQSCPKHKWTEPGVLFPSASSMTHQEGPCCPQALWPCGNQIERPAANSPAIDHPSLYITLPSTTRSWKQRHFKQGQRFLNHASRNLVLNTTS